MFEIVEGIGGADISWSPPASADILAPPTSLTIIPQTLPKEQVQKDRTNKNQTEISSYNIYRSESANARSSGYIIHNTNFSETQFTDIIATDKKFYYQVTAVYSQGESKPSNEASITITRVEENKNTPIEFVLYQNHPNPFNPITKIYYSIPKRSNVVIKVYDMLGKEITTLVNEEKPTGNYEVAFDSYSLSSGVYVYQLKAGSFVESKKMILLK